MPGPGTGEWDGGWSMFTLLLPAEHIPSTESWRLFNLQIMKLQPSGGGFFFFFSHKHIGSGSVNAVEQRPLKSSAEAKNRLNNVFLSFLFCSHSAEIYRAFGEKKKVPGQTRIGNIVIMVCALDHKGCPEQFMFYCIWPCRHSLQKSDLRKPNCM